MLVVGQRKLVTLVQELGLGRVVDIWLLATAPEGVIDQAWKASIIPS